VRVQAFSWRIHLAAALSGFLYYASFPGLDLWPLAFVAWVPWLCALEKAPSGVAFRSGLTMGLVVVFFGFYWLFGMLETFSGFPWPLCALFMFLLSLYQAVRFGLLGWLYVRARRSFVGPPAGVAFVLAFAASETAWPMLFPFTFAGSAVPVPILIQVAEIGGQLLVALTLLGPNWALSRLALWASGRIADKAPLDLASLRPLRVGLGVGFGALLVSLLYGAVRMPMVDAEVRAAKKIKVGLVQANMGLMEKRTNFQEGKQRHVDLTKKLKNEGAEFVVWSETSLAGAVSESDAFRYYEQTLTKNLRVPALVGAVLSRPVDDARHNIYFNSALLADKKGKIRGRYDKHFLLAFGEYLPFGEKYPELYEISANSGRFSPGTTLEPLELGDHRIAVIICYEDIVPSFVKDLMNTNNPELIVNMTNDAWFGDSSEPWEHMALSVFRAVEHRRFFVRSTNSGISGFVDPNGRILKKTKTFEIAAESQELAWLAGRTPFQLLGGVPDLVLTLGSFLLAFFRRPRPLESH
jgi:apolipoprotein N-acyltransferase